MNEVAGNASQPLNSINESHPLTGDLNLVNGNYHDVLVSSLRNDSSQFQVVNKYELDRLQNELAGYIDNKELNSFPVNTNLGLNGKKIVNLAAGSDVSDAVNKQ